MKCSRRVRNSFTEWCCAILDDAVPHRMIDLRAAISTRVQDLPLVVARRATGATTVSATMLLAHKAVRAGTFPSGSCLAPHSVVSMSESLRAAPSASITAMPQSHCLSSQGIRVFVTGGIGGVHRGGEFSWDVSADLTELGRTPVAVVCAGVKSILDIPRTLEYLETQGVMVTTLGSDAFPAFYTCNSSVASPSRVDSPEEARRTAPPAKHSHLSLPEFHRAD